MAFHGSRLSQARRLRGLTQSALATRIGVRSDVISYLERDRHEPSAATLKDLCHALSVTERFFEREPIVGSLDHKLFTFRRISSMRAADKHASAAFAELAIDFLDWIDSEDLELPNPDIPDGSDSEPGAAAAAVREAWGLDSETDTNMVHLLESKGVRIFSMGLRPELDAFSFWDRETPMVFLNMGKPPERGRFDVCHELGHLVLHTEHTQDTPSREREANEFAAEFLMPAESVYRRSRSAYDLRVIDELKVNWGVSSKAMIYRLRKLKMISEWVYRDLLISHASEAGNRSEANGLKQRETSMVWPMVFKELGSEGGVCRAAEELGVQVNDLESLIFDDLLPVRPVR